MSPAQTSPIPTSCSAPIGPTTIRPDGSGNTARPIVRALCFAVMDMGDETRLAIDNNFCFPALEWTDIVARLRDWDRYPVHFLHRLMHGRKVVA